MSIGSGSDASWPELSDLKRALDVTGNDRDDELDALLLSAIDQVKALVGDWDEGSGGDEPDEALGSAALQLAFEIANRDKHDTSDRLLMGHRRRFGVA